MTGALSDPTLELHDSNGAIIASNDNWRDTQEDDIIASTVPPNNDLESAIVATLPASPSGVGYTAIVRGANGSTGVASDRRNHWTVLKEHSAFSSRHSALNDRCGSYPGFMLHFLQWVLWNSDSSSSIC